MGVGAQTILNGDFEDGMAPWSFRQGWSRTCDESMTGECSAHYLGQGGVRTPITTQRFHIAPSGFCQLTVWIKTELLDPAFWPDGEPTRTGISVQLWNRTGSGERVPLDLARQNVYEEGYRGQGGSQDWTKYVGQVAMNEGEWEVRLYMHPIRDRVNGVITKIANAEGEVWVDGVSLIRLR